METLQLTEISPPIPSRLGIKYQCTDKEYDSGTIIGYGDTIQKAIQNYLEWYENKKDVAIQDINYKWV